MEIQGERVIDIAIFQTLMADLAIQLKHTAEYSEKVGRSDLKDIFSELSEIVVAQITMFETILTAIARVQETEEVQEIAETQQ